MVNDEESLSIDLGAQSELPTQAGVFIYRLAH